MGLLSKIRDEFKDRLQYVTPLHKKLRCNKGFLSGLLGSVGASLIGSGVNKLFGGGEEAQSGFNVVSQPLFGHTEQGQAAASGFLQQQLKDLGEGRLPGFFEAQRPLLERGFQRGLSRSFFGLPGRRSEGALSQAVSLGALTGVGPRASVKLGERQLQNFTQQSQAIDEFIAKQGVDIARETALNAPRSLGALPLGPSSTAVPFQTPGRQGLNLGDDFLSTVGGGLSDVFGSIGNKIFGQNQQQPTQVTAQNSRLLRPGNMGTIDFSQFG
jgi:hypothetical protein